MQMLAFVLIPPPPRLAFSRTTIVRFEQTFTLSPYPFLKIQTFKEIPVRSQAD